MLSLPELIDPHRTWALWVQAPLLLAVLLVTGRALWAERPEPRVIVGALVLVAAVALWIPYDAVPWSGHEEHYRELLRGGPAEAGSLESTNAFPLPSGIAWALGQVLPGSWGEALWRWGNRLALGGALVGMAAIARTLGGARAEPWVLGLGILTIPLLGWSTAAYAVAPATMMAAAGLLLALRGDLPGALAWMGLASATRLEWTPLLGAVVGVWWAGRRAQRARAASARGASWGVAIAVLGCEAVLYATKHGGLPGRPELGIALENLGNIPLGGPWFAWTSLMAVLVVWMGMPPASMGRRLHGAWALGLGLTLLSLGTVVDLGARHLLPATLLIVPLCAASLARLGRHSPRWAAQIAVGLAISVVPYSVLGGMALHHRTHEPESPGILPSQTPSSPRTRALATLDPACLLAVPGGEAAYPGAFDSTDVRDVHRIKVRQRQGQCVDWATPAEVRYSGDTRLEFLDRAVRTLDLRGSTWVDHQGQVWLLFQAE